MMKSQGDPACKTPDGKTRLASSVYCLSHWGQKKKEEKKGDIFSVEGKQTFP
jgi:hypothetical protein